MLGRANDVLKDSLKYSVPNAEWSQKFKEREWDGYISLYHKKYRQAPTGLAGKAYSVLKKENIPCKIIDCREAPVGDKGLSTDFKGRELRDYQHEAIRLLLNSSRGILGLATGAGKTMLSCDLIAQINGGPVLFVVPSVALLKQTAKEFRTYIKDNGMDIVIGQIGGGDCNIVLDGINITTYHSALAALNSSFDNKKKKIVDNMASGDKIKETMETLIIKKKTLEQQILEANDKGKKKLNIQLKDIESKIQRKVQLKENKQKIADLINAVVVLIIDEAHIAVEVIEHISLAAKNAYYKVGLSATPSRSDNQDLRMQGALGKVLIRIRASELIQRGYLVKPAIFTIPLTKDYGGHSYAESYSLNIVQNAERNYRIKQTAETFRANGEPVLILVERLEHGKTLEKMISNAVFVPGGDDSDDPISDEELDYRASMLKKTEKNEIILIATQWANQGVDAPAISTLILGGSATQENVLFQQIGRVLRTSSDTGKNRAYIFDFIPKSKTFKSHFEDRLEVYLQEDEFEIIKIS